MTPTEQRWMRYGDFSQTVYAAMKSAKLSQKDLAKAIGCSPQFLTDVFKGRRMFGPELAFKIAKKLKLNGNDMGYEIREELFRRWLES